MQVKWAVLSQRRAKAHIRDWDGLQQVLAENGEGDGDGEFR